MRASKVPVLEALGIGKHGVGLGRRGMKNPRRIGQAKSFGGRSNRGHSASLRNTAIRQILDEQLDHPAATAGRSVGAQINWRRFLDLENGQIKQHPSSDVLAPWNRNRKRNTNSKVDENSSLPLCNPGHSGHEMGEMTSGQCDPQKPSSSWISKFSCPAPHLQDNQSPHPQTTGAGQNILNYYHNNHHDAPSSSAAARQENLEKGNATFGRVDEQLPEAVISDLFKFKIG